MPFSSTPTLPTLRVTSLKLHVNVIKDIVGDCEEEHDGFI
jgi:hypothetical protein